MPRHSPPAFRHAVTARRPSEPTHACPQCAHAENDWRTAAIIFFDRRMSATPR